MNFDIYSPILLQKGRGESFGKRHKLRLFLTAELDICGGGNCSLGTIGLNSLANKIHCPN